jgi:hypothetical protein
MLSTGLERLSYQLPSRKSDTMKIVEMVFQPTTRLWWRFSPSPLGATTANGEFGQHFCSSGLMARKIFADTPLSSKLPMR